MEHRLCKRVDVDVDVVIYCHGLVAARGKVRNLSRDGMFIETAVMSCPANISVDVGLVACKNGALDEQRVRAYVIHRTNAGIGLMFVMPNNDQYYQLRGLG